MKHIHVETPCILSSPLTRIVGREVFLKLENYQTSGSFKLRGIGLLFTEAAQNGSRQFISSFGGHAGLAATYSSVFLRVCMA